MTDSQQTAALLALMQGYAKRLDADPDLKEAPLDFDENRVLRVRPELGNLWLREDIQSKSFAKFAFAKYALELCIRTNYLTDVRDLIAPWLNACVDVGAYEACRDFAEVCMKSEVLKVKMRPAEYFSMLRCHAKSLRNLGKFPQAQDAYRRLINAAGEMGAQTDLNFGLLLIGKLYGNYLGQRSLFSSFVEESMAGFRELDRPNISEEERRRIHLGLAICHDALGQAYRGSHDREKVERHFLEAVRLNEEIGRVGGVSRAYCHLYSFKFKHAMSPQDMASYMEDFVQKGMALVVRERDEGGMSIRFIQFASMLHKVGQTEKALTYLMSGKSLAQRYSLYKTFTQAIIVETEIYSSVDADRAVSALEEGRRTAQFRNLMVQETEINRLLAELASTVPDSRQLGPKSKPFDLFSRNRIILMDLIGEVKETLTQLDTLDERKAEFKRLRRKTRLTFREKLLLDFEQIVEQLDLNILSLLRTFNHDGQQAHNIFEIVSSVTPLFFEDYEAFVLADTILTAFDDVAAEAERLAAPPRRDKQKGRKAEPGRSDQVVALGHLSAQMKALSGDLRKLRSLLSGRVGQSEVLGRFGLREVCQQAIAELRQQMPRGKDLIVFRADCDVQVKFYHRMLVTAVRNLLRSLVAAAENANSRKSKVVVSLRPGPSRFSTLRNQFKNAVLSAEASLGDEDGARELATTLYNGLEGNPSQALFGAGSGLDLPKFVFKERLGAGISVTREKNTVVVEIILEADIIQLGMLEDAEG